MNINKLLLTAMGSLLMSSSFAQSHQCGTDSYADLMKGRDSSLHQKEKDWNIFAKAFKNVDRRASKYIIPVVFHVIHTNGDGNISKEQIEDQIRVINEDFSLTNANKSGIRAPFINDATNMEIEFRLAKIDPSGNCTNGINRVFSPFTNNSSQSTEEIKSLDGVQWNYQQYLNIYVVNSIENSSGTGTTLGYATLPFGTSANRDGIVLRHDRLGTIGSAIGSGDGGRTLTHEIGHWLGLFHTFQGGCSGFGDGCDDTPPVLSTFTNAGCPSNGNSCNSDSPDRIDMWENYMDYSRGTCMAMFTNDQKTRVYSSLARSPRSNLYRSSNLIATGVQDGTGTPQAYFSSNQRIICTGSPVTFFDNSCKANVDSRIWTFEGGTPNGTTIESPAVIYNTPGKYAVKLQVTNSSGSTIANETEYITVIDAKGQAPKYFETFENVAGPDFKITPVFKTGSQWEENTSVGYKSQKCYQARVSSSTTMGTVYSIQLPPVNLKEMQGQQPRLSFFTSYAPHTSATNTETLKVLISTDCGHSFQPFIQRLGAGLAYLRAPQVENFVPTSDDQWKLINFSLTKFDSVESAIFRFDVETRGGNSVYIDDINIGRFASSTNDIPSLGMSIFPNPTESDVTIRLDKEQWIQSVIIRDCAGKIVDVQEVNTFSSSTQFKNKKNLKGLYLVSINTSLGKSTSSIIFE